MIEINQEPYLLTEKDKQWVLSHSNNGFVIIDVKPELVKKVNVKFSDDTRGVQTQYPKTIIRLSGTGADENGNAVQYRAYANKNISPDGKNTYYSPESIPFDKRLRLELTNPISMDYMYVILKTSKLIEDSEACVKGQGRLYIYDEGKVSRERLQRKRMKNKLLSKIDEMSAKQLDKACIMLKLNATNRDIETKRDLVHTRVEQQFDSMTIEQFQKDWGGLLDTGDVSELRVMIETALTDKTIMLITKDNAPAPLKQHRKGWYFVTENGSLSPDGFICQAPAEMANALPKLIQHLQGSEDDRNRLMLLLGTSRVPSEVELDV